MINNNREQGTKEAVICSFLFVRKEFMKEVILVLIIRGIGLFTRLSRRGKKNQKK